MSSSPTPHFQPVIISGRYAVLRKLGSGSIGTVYLAFDQVERREVALKLLRTEALITRSGKQIQEEFRAIGALEHPQIAKAHDFGYTERDGVPFYTREHIAGQPLPPGPPDSRPPEQFLRPVLDLLDALEYVHNQGILHLDVHAGNLIVADDARRGSVLIDFGLPPSPAALSRSLRSASWPNLPPEMLAGKPPGPATDIYLVGRLLLYRITGRTSGEPALPREIPGWGARHTLEIERILHKSLAVDPEKRFACAGDFRAALLRVTGSSPQGNRRVEPKRTLVGRDAELAEIDAVIGAALDDSPALLRLTGPPGIGKSALLAEARLRAQLRGLNTVSVRFSQEPAPALVRAIRKLRGPRRGQTSWLEWLSPRCGGSPGERAARAAAAYFLEPEKPMALLLDDVHLADRESRLLIDALLAEIDTRRSAGSGGRGLAIVLSLKSAPGDARDRDRSVRALRGLPVSIARELFVQLVRPLAPPPALVRSAVASARGSPLLLGRLASAVRQSWSERKALPSPEELASSCFAGRGLVDWKGVPDTERELLTALAILKRPATLEELAIASGFPSPKVAGSLERLEALEAVSHRGRGAARRFHLANVDAVKALARATPRKVARGIHTRLAAHLSSLRNPTADTLGNLAVHLLALGKRRQGPRKAIEAARRLRAGDSRERALSLLDHALAQATGSSLRMEIVELLSDVLDEVGDHERGASILEPIFRSKGLPRADEVRAGRRLGVHLHRLGLPARALAVFERVRAIMDPAKDLENVVRIESEVAELEIFRGNLAVAEEACRRGLAHVSGFQGRSKFLGRMEVMLRASLGHLELRRLRFASARVELLRALALSRKLGDATDRSAILQNLGVASNESNDLAGARRRFEEAARLLRRGGDRQDLIKVSNNLALIHAKLGDAPAAEMHLEKAASLLRHFPVRRLECFTAYSRGLVRLLFGLCEEALSSLEEAASRSHEIGDSTMEAFARVFASEAALHSGKYERAGAHLKSAARLDRGNLPVLRRMIASRLFLLEAVLGRSKRAQIALLRFHAAERSSVEYLEAWNDLFLALGLLVNRREATEVLERCHRAFRSFGVSSGERFAKLGLLYDSLARPDLGGLRERRRAVAGAGEARHRLLQVVEPLALAEASLAMGEHDAALEHLSVASSAIVGSPFVEADWRLELLRAGLAARMGDPGESRRHLHRAIHCRNLLVQLIPGPARESFLAHPRFQELGQAEAKLGSAAIHIPSTESQRRARGLEGLLGQSAPMMAIFQMIERLRDQEVPVLIRGETGTGKELVARAIHSRSPRRDRPFQVLHCGCLPPELFESELFGHVAGAFTGAERDQHGLLEAVTGGTVLLDDLHLLPLESQAKLLGVAQSMSIRKLGSLAATPIDVRFLATATTDLRFAVKEGRFHEGLYFRLAGVELELPPLRERPGDVGLLSRHFLERHAVRLDRQVSALEDEALARLERYSWPGNVRELESVLLRVLIAQTRPDPITPGDVEALLASPGPGRAGAAIPSGRPLLARGLDEWRQDLERGYLTELLLELRMDIAAAARRLGVRRSKLYEWCRKLGIDVKALRKR